MQVTQLNNDTFYLETNNGTKFILDRTTHYVRAIGNGISERIRLDEIGASERDWPEVAICLLPDWAQKDFDQVVFA